MMNILRADIFRLKRGKGLLVAFGIVMAFSVVMIVALGRAGDLTGANSVNILFEMSLWLVFMMLPFITVVTGPIFVDGTAKNEVAWGASRTKLYASRLLIMAVICMLVLVLYIGTGMALATILHGFGNVADGYWLNLLQTFGAQWFMFFAASSLGVFMVFTIKNVVVVAEIFIGVLAVPGIIGGMLDISILLDIDLMTNVGRLGSLYGMENSAILLSLAVGAFWLIIATAVGLFMFQKAEIK